MQLHTNILIIGAGVSGSMLARGLSAHGIDSVVLDKGRGMGGRMSTRRNGDTWHDHGAQFITVRDQRVRKLFAGLLAEGIVREWFNADTDGLPRYCGVHGMSGIVTALANGCDVRVNAEVESVSHDGIVWTVRCRDSRMFTANTLVSSAPVPQTLQLLENGNVAIDEDVRGVLTSVRYERCIAALVRTTLPIDVRRAIQPDIAYVGDNHDKGISVEPSYTIHATAEFSERMWDADRIEVATHLAKCVFGDDLEGVVEVGVHAWKYSRPLTTTSSTFIRALDNPPLILIGDAFGGPRVEGAIISALDAIEEIIGS